jgi:hypothetical protein
MLCVESLGLDERSREVERRLELRLLLYTLTWFARASRFTSCLADIAVVMEYAGNVQATKETERERPRAPRWDRPRAPGSRVTTTCSSSTCPAMQTRTLRLTTTTSLLATQR